MNNEIVSPNEEARKEAKRFPNAWIYVIDKKYKGKSQVPPSAIVGAWKVDAFGNIEGDFIPNPNYNPEA